MISYTFWSGVSIGLLAGWLVWLGFWAIFAVVVAVGKAKTRRRLGSAKAESVEVSILFRDLPIVEEIAEVVQSKKHLVERYQSAFAFLYENRGSAEPADPAARLKAAHRWITQVVQVLKTSVPKENAPS